MLTCFFMISALYSINSIDDQEKKDEVETTTKHQNERKSVSIDYDETKSEDKH